MPATQAAVHAALEHERQKQAEEEEKMTRYTSEDIEDGWEFKIVRSTFGAFRKPEVLRTLVEEESQAGWELLEKFDDYRVRFKRPINARKNDIMLPDYIDPYRTQYGSLGNRSALIVVGLITALLLAAGVALLIFQAL